MEIENTSPKRNRPRYYSFKKGKKLNWHNMLVINGTKIPSQKGSTFFGIICALAANKNKFCPWWRIIELCEMFICQHAGEQYWKRFVEKSDVKSIQSRIKQNTYTLTRKGKNTYGYRLHELGMGVYFFRDGAMLLTDGEYIETDNDYNVKFPDGRELQYKYNGTNFTSREYRDFVKIGLITRSCRIVDQERLMYHRLTVPVKLDTLEVTDVSAKNIMVTVELDESYDQNTATRLEGLEFTIDTVDGLKLTGRIPATNIERLKQDSDVKLVVLSDL